MPLKKAVDISAAQKSGWSKYLGSGTLLGDGLDIAANFGKYLSTAFGITNHKVQEEIYKSPPIAVLEQDLVLNVTTRSSAKRAAKLMLARLSPLPEAQIEWDITGPHGTADIQPDNKGGEQFKNIQSKFTLGIVRRKDLEDWDILNEGHTSLKTMGRCGDIYKFTSTLHRRTRRKQTLLFSLAFIGCYLGLLWGASQWANRPSLITDKWQDQARLIRLSNQDDRSKLENIQVSTALSEQYNENALGTNILDMLADMTASIPDGGWIREMNFSGNQIRLSGITDDPAKLAAQMETKPYIQQVLLGAISADRSSGLQRFTLTLITAEGTP